MTKEELQKVKDDARQAQVALVRAEQAYRMSRVDIRRTVTEQLNQKRREIEALVAEAEKLAATADLVFYYSSGYDGFSITEQENWSESSKHC